MMWLDVMEKKERFGRSTYDMLMFLYTLRLIGGASWRGKCSSFLNTYESVGQLS